MFAVQAFQFIDYFGVIVFAITGALVAARKEADIVTFVVLGTVTGIGGGTLRDMILGISPVLWVQNPRYLVLCAGTSVLVFFAAHYISRRQKIILWADAIGLSVFAVIGAQVALSHDAPVLVAALMGMVTATFGGIIRDTLSGEESLLLKKEIYLSACFAGALLYIGLVKLTGLSEISSVWIASISTFVIRAAALLYDLRLPGYKWIQK